MLQEILIILQTHSKGNPPDIGDLQRYCSDTKSEVSRRCVSSLFHTIEFAKNQLPNFNFKLIILNSFHRSYWQYILTCFCRSRHL